MNSVICAVFGLLAVFWSVNAQWGCVMHMQDGESDSCTYKSFEMSINETLQTNSCETCTCHRDHVFCCTVNVHISSHDPECVIVPREDGCGSKAVLQEDPTVTCPHYVVPV